MCVTYVHFVSALSKGCVFLMCVYIPHLQSIVYYIAYVRTNVRNLIRRIFPLFLIIKQKLLITLGYYDVKTRRQNLTNSFKAK